MIDNEIEDIDNDEIIDDNEEIAEDIEKFDPSDIVVYSRDWTIETIQAQIKGGNIDLNPNFQRRNAWSDDKRSKLIESILIGYPVPEIVLAEDPKKKKAFIVIDGKQRLLTIAGFIDHATFNYWNTPKLKKLKVRDDLEGLTYEKLSTEPVYSDEFREFQNSSLRCTVITNFSTTDVLYDIFYRLNSGSVPLATQELRQVLNKGEFANYLIDITNTKQPIHDVLNLKGPDKRLKDIEIILRLIAFRLFAKDYTGNLKNFLDDKMAFISVNWSDYKEIVEKIYQEINATIVYLTQIFGAVKKVGRKATNSVIEPRFNRVIFEVEIFYFSQLDRDSLGDSSDFISNYIELSSNDVEFRNSVESSTKKIQYYQDRYQKFQNLINDSFGISTDLYPFN
mgnify:CR=1 FL=1|tara:strand:- start:672 stop:1853 length:1182 start_codon:yes stop_codon:yes gene_type:complete